MVRSLFTAILVVENRKSTPFVMIGVFVQDGPSSDSVIGRIPGVWIAGNAYDFATLLIEAGLTQIRRIPRITFNVAVEPLGTYIQGLIPWYLNTRNRMFVCTQAV